MSILIMLGLSFLFFGCNPNAQLVKEVEQNPPIEVQFRYPFSNSSEVPVSSRIFAVVSYKGDADSEDFAISLETAHGEVKGESKLRPHGVEGVLLTFVPEKKLGCSVTYKAQLWQGAEDLGHFWFTTEGKDPKEFYLRRMTPTNSINQKVMDHSTIRLTFSQDIDESKVFGHVYLLDEGAKKVDATLLVKGNRLSLDPVKDLVENKTYQLIIEDQLTSLSGQRSQPQAIDITPLSSGKPLFVAMDVGGGGGISQLSLKPSGIAELSSVLAGDLKVEVKGTLQGEMGSLLRHPKVTPVVIRKGSRILGMPQKIMLGGTLDSGLESGEVYLEFLSDANGFLFPRPHGKGDGGLSLLLYADVGIQVESPQIQKLLGSESLHIAMMGVAKLVGKEFVVDMESDFELNLMGLEKASVNFSSHVAAPLEESFYVPSLGPSFKFIQDQFLGEGPGGGELGISFNTSLDIKSLETIRELGSDLAVPFARKRGSQLILNLKNFAKGEPLEIDLSGVRNISGQKIENAVIKINSKNENQNRAFFDFPFVMAVYPGYPCLLFGGDWRDGGELAGKCRSDLRDKTPPKMLKLPEYAPSRPLTVLFNRLVDIASISQATDCQDESASIGLFRYEAYGDDMRLRCAKALPVLFELWGRKLEITPQTPLKPGRLYALRLGRRNGSVYLNSECHRGDICSLEQGLPLRTHPISPIDDEFGSFWEDDDMLLPFRAAENNGGVLIAGENYSNDNYFAINLDRSSGEAFSGILSSVHLAKNKLALRGAILCEFQKSDQDGQISLRLYPSQLSIEGMTIRATALDSDLSIFNLELNSGPMIAQLGGGQVLHLDEDDKGMYVKGNLTLTLQAPFLNILSGGVQLFTDLPGKKVSTTVEGRVEFSKEGHLITKLSNQYRIRLPITVSLGEELAKIFLEVPLGGLQMEVLSRN